jgi:hypothetical protein
VYDLIKLIRLNEDTEFGRKYSFDKVKSIADFQNSVPILTYDDFLPYIEKVANGEDNILTAEPVLMFEPSSGSTSATKLIPYTQSLKNEFLRGLTPWLTDLQRNFRGIFEGSVYFSVTPSIRHDKATKGGIPIGFEDETEYLGDFGKDLNFCVPAEIKDEKNMDGFMKKTLFHMVNAGDLRFISIWNPTFLMLLTKHLSSTKDLFPKLEVISCWADGNSKKYAEQLEKMFPEVHIQPKGLLATEAIMTIPIEGKGKRLTEAHFFEFMDMSGNVHLPEDLQAGEVYDIILTQGGGLYRYKIGDLVEYKGDNCFDFLGKSGNVSDYFGEKLNEVHVRKVIEGDKFSLLVPNGNGYTLYTENYADKDKIEAGLRENYHYDYCRKLGQLQAVEVVNIEKGEESYMANCLRFGMRLGDIKSQYLSNKEGWVFEARGGSAT